MAMDAPGFSIPTCAADAVQPPGRGGSRDERVVNSEVVLHLATAGCRVG